MIIELIGIPGSGKTYISKLLIEYSNKSEHFQNDNRFLLLNQSEMMDDNINIFRLFISKIWKNLLTISLSTFFDMFSILTSNQSVKTGLYLSLYYFGVIKRYQFYFENYNIQSESLVLDEGLFHAICGSYSKNNDEKFKKVIERTIVNTENKKYYPFNRENHIFVFVSSNIEESFKRIENRSSGWPKMYKDLNQFEKKLKLENFASRVNQFKKRLDNHHFITFELCSNDSIDQQIADLFKMIESIKMREDKNV